MEQKMTLSQFAAYLLAVTTLFLLAAHLENIFGY